MVSMASSGSPELSDELQSYDFLALIGSREWEEGALGQWNVGRIEEELGKGKFSTLTCSSFVLEGGGGVSTLKGIWNGVYFATIKELFPS